MKRDVRRSTHSVFVEVHDHDGCIVMCYGVPVGASLTIRNPRTRPGLHRSKYSAPVATKPAKARGRRT
jgi:hypothetical protein